MHERREARRVEPLAEARLDGAREREIDVVAAEEEVVPHREAGERGLLVPHLGAEQGEVGRAAAHVTHQQQMHPGQCLFEIAAVAP